LKDGIKIVLVPLDKAVGVQGLGVEAHLVVQMLTCTEPRVSHIAYDITFFYKITFFDTDFSQMRIQSLEPKNVIDPHHVSISVAADPGLGDDAVGGGSDGNFAKSADIDPRMELLLFQNRVFAPSKGSGDGELLDRVARWDKGQDKLFILQGKILDIGGRLEKFVS